MSTRLPIPSTTVPRFPPSGMIELDRHGRVTDVNDRILEWVGRERAEVIGSTLSTLLEVRLPVRTGLGDVPPDAKLRHRLGTVRSVAVSTLESEERGDTRLVVVDLSLGSPFGRAFQIGDRRSRRGQERLEILLEASTGFANVRTEAQIADLLSEVARRAFAATAVSVYLVRDGGMGRAGGTDPLAPFYPATAPPAGQTTLLGREVLVVTSPDVAAEYVRGIDAAYRSAGIEAALASPILHEGVPLGSMVCFFDHPRVFDEEAVPLAEALANQAGQALTRVRLEEGAVRAAMLDDVTGLPHRRLFEEELSRMVGGEHAALAVLFIDLDRFKSVNDELGHPVGDQLLMQVGRRLRAAVREHDVVGRFSGDEFVVVAAVDHDRDAQALAERIRAVLAEPYDGIPGHLRVSASIGLVVTRSMLQSASTSDHLIRAADHAMYDAKSAGGDRVAVAV